MGFNLSLEDQEGNRAPHKFNKTTGRQLANELLISLVGEYGYSLFRELAERADTDYLPLEKFTGVDYGFEEYLASSSSYEEAETAYEEQKKSSEAAWQEPEVLEECFRAIIAYLENTPDITSEFRITPEMTHEYVSSGLLESDLRDLEVMTKWFIDNNSAMVRMKIS